MESLGKRIERARNNKDLSQEALARELQVSRQMVSKWELDQAVPKTSRIEKICKTLDISVNELVYGIDNKISKDSQEKDASTVDSKSIRLKMLINRIAVTACILVIILVASYLAYSVYKLVILNTLSSKVAKYANLENYYCKIISYDDKGLDSTQEIWYKDGVYKIVDIINENNEKIKSTKILDLNKQKRYIFNDEEKTVIEKKLLQTDDYENGIYMYKQFPQVLKEEKQKYKSISFSFKKLSYYVEDGVIILEVNNEAIQLEKDTYLPISAMDIENLKEKKKSQKIREYYSIDLNSVKEEDINIPNEYNLVK